MWTDQSVIVFLCSKISSVFYDFVLSFLPFYKKQDKIYYLENMSLWLLIDECFQEIKWRATNWLCLLWTHWSKFVYILFSHLYLISGWAWPTTLGVFYSLEWITRTSSLFSRLKILKQEVTRISHKLVHQESGLDMVLKSNHKLQHVRQ